jgi:hypothetical protein
MSDGPHLSVSTHIGLLNAGLERMRQLAAEDAPRDCVRALPSVNPDYVVLSGFDPEGRSRIKVEIEIDAVTTQWERWILRYVRHRYGRGLHVLK